MHYLIFIPNANDATGPGKLAEVGLADHVAGAEFLVTDVGPENQAGVLIAWRKPGDGCDFCYAPERQTWVPAAIAGELPRGRYFVGFANEKLPRPEELQRPYPYRGPVMDLAGAAWRIPAPKELPHDLILADDGSLKFQIQRQYHEYTLRAGTWLEMVQAAAEDAGAGLDYADMWAFVVQALRINYRITPEVVSYLRLFDQHNVIRALFAAIGIASDTAR